MIYSPRWKVKLEVAYSVFIMYSYRLRNGWNLGGFLSWILEYFLWIFMQDIRIFNVGL